MSELDSEVQITVRPAIVSDSLLFWRWVNDPDVRSNSFSNDSIPYDVHVKWFDSKLNSELTRMYILELDGDPVGQIRYDRTADGSAEIDFSIAKSQRGQGLGSLIIESTRQKACSELSVCLLVGFVKSTNLKSCRVFERVGFEKNESLTRSEQNYEIFLWRCD